MDDSPPWRWRDARLRPWVTDGLLGVAVAAVQLLMLALGVNRGGPVPYTKPNALTVLLILVQGLPLAWRRRRPLLVFAVVLAANTAYYAIAFPPSQFDFGLPIALFTVAAERSQRISLLACVTVLVLFAAQWLGRVGVYWSYANWVRVLYLLFFFQRRVGLGPLCSDAPRLHCRAGHPGRVGRARPPTGGAAGGGGRAGQDRPRAA
jgi:hypothetical protein